MHIKPPPPAGKRHLALLASLFASVWLLATIPLGCDTNTQEPTTDTGKKETTNKDAGDTPDNTTKETPKDTAPSYPLDDKLKLNHIQAKGTHNSYHLDPGQGVDEWRYEHKPLDVQLGEQGVRQFELDAHWNEGIQGFLVYHLPVLDQKTSCNTFVDCLNVIKKWSDANRGHLPIFIFIEAKSLGKKPPKEAFEVLEKETLSVFPKERIVLPEDVRGTHPNLKEAVAKDGWPTLGKVRGKVVFVMLMGGENRKIFTNGDKDLKGRIMFITAEPDSPYAAVIKMDGPVGSEDKIKAAVKAGAIVRTRADAALEEPKKGDRSRLEAALRSGAHFLSTDYPAPVDGVNYHVDIPDGTPARCNPITAPPECTSAALENLK